MPRTIEASGVEGSEPHDELLTRLAHLVKRLIDYRTFGIALWNGGDEIRFEIEIEERKRLPKRKRKWVSGLTEYLLTSRQPLLIARQRGEVGAPGLVPAATSFPRS